MRKLTFAVMTLTAVACNQGPQGKGPQKEPGGFDYTVDRFADVEILRYRVPGFEGLSLRQKTLAYYLVQAALEGRDILYDQNGRYNLRIRRTLEAVYQGYKGNRNSEEFAGLELYLKQVWMGNGIHHHYSTDKFKPLFSREFFAAAVAGLDPALLPLEEGETAEQLVAELAPVIFDPALHAKRVNQEDGVDLILASASNYYGEGVSQAEVEGFYGKMKDPADPAPAPYGLNSQLVKEGGRLVERTYKAGGMYSAAIGRIMGWLRKAAEVAENDKQKAVIDALVEYYQTGDLKAYDRYSILWVQDVDSRVDFVNGFTETYGDPLGLKGAWESLVDFKDLDATKRTETISANAQWFEDNSPVARQFKKERVKGVSAKAVTAAVLAGDCYPATPIGINLPNSNWIRAAHGSKSVTIVNITDAYDKAALGNGFAEEFMWSDTERKRNEKYAALTDNLHTDLHECLGHASGKLMPGVDPDALKAYGAVIEEARADLFGLYYLGDAKLVELGLVPDREAYKAEYYKYMMNGLMTQLTRIVPGDNIEEAHMRNRQLIAAWVREQGKDGNVVEFKKRDGKTFVVVNDYGRLRDLFGRLLAEIQRIKSTGDYAAGRDLVEKYGVRADRALNEEVLARYQKLGLAPYKGFVNPVYTPVTDKDGKITDVKISYDENYVEQNLRYSREYSALPGRN